jgi:tetratricopeptide (TPR) repeat protein
MMKKIIPILFTLFSITTSIAAQDKGRQSNIHAIFDRMELAGVNTQQPLLYGYFFFDGDKSKLEKLNHELLKENYKLVRLEKTSKQNFILHVEKVEIHSRASLLERETQLDQMAKKFQVEIYDGWDVGNPDPTKPLVVNNSFENSLNNKSDAELFAIANGFYDSETNDKAVVVFQKCIEHNFKSDTCYYKQGVSYIGLGQTKIGVEKLEEALKINPGYYKACFNIGAICYDNLEYQKSIDYYQKAAKLDPNDDRSYYGMALSQFAIGQIKEAETNCQTALNLNSGNFEARLLLDLIKRKK